jgi:threonine dehydratase
MTISPEVPTIREAQSLLRAYFGVTPLVMAPSLSRPGAEVFLKIETGLPTGSFKPRGALFALAANLQRRTIEEVTASSTGNHGAAVSFAAKTLGVRATIFLPENPNPVKRKKIEELGARIVETGSADLAQACEHAKEYSSRPGIYFLNDATDPDLPAGPATIGLEILDQLPDVSAVFVPMGDTALIRGVAAAIKQLAPAVKMVGVQAERAPSYCLSWREGNPVLTDSCDTCADGLATRTPDSQNVAAIRQVVDDVALVSEAQMIDAIRGLYRDEKVLAEPAGAAATAAWLDWPHASGKVALLVTGANLSETVRRQAGI